MTDFFTSDQHFFHTNIIKYCDRPFPDAETMNFEIIERWNAVVKENDNVYVLGDLTLKPQFLGELLPQLKGNKFLVPGNHDSCHPMHKGHKREALKYQVAGINVLDTFELLRVDTQHVTLCHFPWAEHAGADARYPEWRPRREESVRVAFHLSGHVHEKWKYKPEGRNVNVGVDQWDFTPVTLEQIARYVESIS